MVIPTKYYNYWHPFTWKSLIWLCSFTQVIEQIHHNQLPIRTSCFWTDPKSVSESQYTNTNQPKPHHTVPNNNLFYTPRKPKTAKAENRSSFFLKCQLFSNAKWFKTVVYDKLALWTTIFSRNKPKLYQWCFLFRLKKYILSNDRLSL